jgi:hypothetical protein
MDASIVRSTVPVGATAGFEPSGDMTVGGGDGLVVDRHRTARRVLTGLGLTAAGLGAAFLAARGAGVQPVLQASVRSPGLLPAAIGAAVLGTGTAALSMGTLRARMQEYTQVVDGSLREASATAQELGGDVGIVKAGDDRWGLMTLDKPIADARGGGAATLSNPPIQFAAVTSRDGDTWVRRGGSFENMGAATAIDAGSINPTDPASVRSLVGAKVAVTADGAGTVRLGEPLLGGAPAASKGEAAAQLFELGIDDAVLLDTGAGVLAYEAQGAADAGNLHARGTAVQPVGALTLLANNTDGPTASSAGGVGSLLDSESLSRPLLDTTKVAVADAGSLTGRRIAGSAGSVVQLGKLLSTHATLDEGIAAGASNGSRTLVAKLADGVAVYQLPGKADQALVTALRAGGDRLSVVQERKRFSVAEDGTVTFQARSVPFETSEPIGRKLDSGAIAGTATKLHGSYASREAALKDIRGDLETRTPFVVVEAAGADGKFHAYVVDRSGSGKAWDTDLGRTTMGAWHNPSVKRSVEEVERHPSTWGTDLHYFNRTSERTVRFLDEGARTTEVATSPTREVSRMRSHIVRAFDPHEAVGHTVRLGGESLRMGGYVHSTDSSHAARAFIDRSAADPSAFVVLERENNRGRFHIYASTPTTSWSASWTSSRAEPRMASWTEPQMRSYSDTERRNGQHGTDIYHYDVTERWSERRLSEGWSARTTDSTSKRVDRVLNRIVYADPPLPPSGGGTSPGDTGGSTSPGDSGGSTWPGSGGSTSPGDSGGSTWPGSGGSTSPGDSGGSTSPGSGGSTSPGSGGGNSTDNGNPSWDDF